MPERKIILGVDPGLGGALALLDGDGGLVVHDMPTHKLTRGRKAKRELDRYELARIRKRARADYEAYCAMIDRKPRRIRSLEYSMLSIHRPVNRSRTQAPNTGSATNR